MKFVYLLILSHHIFLEAESYALNPRAIHPDGRLPTITQAKKKVDLIREQIFKGRNDDDMSVSTIIFVDGNNIRNSFGFQYMSALQLTKKMTAWVDESKVNGTSNESVGQAQTTFVARSNPNIICVWDGGSKRSSQMALSKSEVVGYSGPDRNADDLIVQCCSFVTSQMHDDSHIKLTVVVFTSDVNLANRCQMQLMEDKSSRLEFQIYHSIHFQLLLGNNSNSETTDRVRDVFAPDWERKERRESVIELQSFLEDQGKGVHEDEDLEYIHLIHDWINNGLQGLKIGRVTKGGSILYTCK